MSCFCRPKLYSKQGAKPRLAEVVEKAERKPAEEIARLAPEERKMLRTILALGIQGSRDAEEAHRRSQQALTLFDDDGRTDDAQGKAEAGPGGGRDRCPSGADLSAQPAGTSRPAQATAATGHPVCRAGPPRCLARPTPAR